VKVDAEEFRSSGARIERVIGERRQPWSADFPRPRDEAEARLVRRS